MYADIGHLGFDQVWDNWPIATVLTLIIRTVKNNDFDDHSA